MQSSVCFFNINFIAEDALPWVVEAYVVDEVEEAEECVPEQDPWDLFFVASLVDGKLMFVAIREVVADPFFGYYFATCVDCILMLESHWVYFCVF